MVVAFMLPEWLARSSKDSIGLMPGKPLKRSQPSRGHDAGSHQDMNMIRHDNVGMQFVPVEPAFAIANSLNNECRNFRYAQVPRPGLCTIQDAVHRDERLAAR